MLANLISPIVRCFPRVVRARPRISAAAVTPAARPIVRAAIRRVPRLALVCTITTLPSAAMLPVPPAPPPAPAAAAAAPLAAPAAPLPYGIGAAPVLPPAFSPGRDRYAGPPPSAGHAALPPAGDTPAEVAPPPREPATQVPEPGFMFATGLAALLAVLVARRRRPNRW